MTQHRYSHAHAGHPVPPVALRGDQVLAGLVVLLVAVTALGLVLLRPDGGPAADPLPESGERVRGTVTAVAQVSCEGPEPGEDVGSGDGGCQRVTVRIEEGSDEGA